MQRITCFTAVKIIWFDTLWCEMVYILTLKPTNWSACPVRSWGMETWIYISTKNSLFPSVHLCKLLKQKKPTQFKNKLPSIYYYFKKRNTHLVANFQLSLPSNKTMPYAGGQAYKGRGTKSNFSLMTGFLFLCIWNHYSYYTLERILCKLIINLFH